MKFSRKVLVATVLVALVGTFGFGDSNVLSQHLLKIAVRAHMRASSVLEVEVEPAITQAGAPITRVAECHYVHMRNGEVSTNAFRFRISKDPEMPEVLNLEHRSATFMRQHGIFVWVSELAPGDPTLLAQTFPIDPNVQTLVIAPSDLAEASTGLPEVLTISAAPGSNTTSVALGIARAGHRSAHYTAVVRGTRKLRVFALPGQYDFSLNLLDGSVTPTQSFSVGVGDAPYQYTLP